MNARAVRTAALAAAFTLGCAARAPAPSPVEDRVGAWLGHHSAVTAVSGFTLEGRVAASPAPMSGRLLWRQAPGGDFDLHLSGPLGSGSLRLRGTPERVRVESRDGVFETTEPEATLLAQFGWSLPLASLADWVRGLPRSGEPARYLLDGQGRLAVLEQGGWRVHYERYHEGPPALPARLQLSQGERRLTVLVDRWQPGPPR